MRRAGCAVVGDGRRLGIRIDLNRALKVTRGQTTGTTVGTVCALAVIPVAAGVGRLAGATGAIDTAVVLGNCRKLGGTRRRTVPWAQRMGR